jgi:hypothetical protein
MRQAHKPGQPDNCRFFAADFRWQPRGRDWCSVRCAARAGVAQTLYHETAVSWELRLELAEERTAKLHSKHCGKQVIERRNTRGPLESAMRRYHTPGQTMTPRD